MTLTNDVQIAEKNGELIVKGKLTFDTVLDAYEKAKPFFNAKKTLQINLGEVAESDSASLSLLARWMRLAKTNQIQLTFSSLPKKMLSQSRVSGFDAVLPITHII